MAQKAILDNKALEDIDLNAYLPKTGGTISGSLSINNYLNNVKFGGVILPDSTAFTTSFTSDIFGTEDNNNFKFKILRMRGSAPDCVTSNHGSGIAWKGSDTYGALSVRYSSPSIKIAGGNGTNPVWWFGINASSGVTYNLENINGNYAYLNTWTEATSSSGQFSKALTITTKGRPVFIAFSWDMQGGWCTGAVYRGNTQLKARTTVGNNSDNNCGIITYLDVVSAGTYTYNFYLKSGSGTIAYNETNLFGNEQPSICIFEI